MANAPLRHHDSMGSLMESAATVSPTETGEAKVVVPSPETEEEGNGVGADSQKSGTDDVDEEHT